MYTYIHTYIHTKDIASNEQLQLTNNTKGMQTKKGADKKDADEKDADNTKITAVAYK